MPTMVMNGQSSFTVLSMEQQDAGHAKYAAPFLVLSEAAAVAHSRISKYEKHAQSGFMIPLQRGRLPEKKGLGYCYKPTSFDVICAKGNAARDHTGNRRFRLLIDMNLNRYRKAGKSKTLKSSIVTDIIDTVQSSSPGGGFIQMSEGEWCQVSEHHAREKVGQSFRDRLHLEYKSSSKAKIRKRKTEELKYLGDQAMSSLKAHGVEAAATETRRSALKSSKQDTGDCRNDDGICCPSDHSSDVRTQEMHRGSSSQQTDEDTIKLTMPDTKVQKSWARKQGCDAASKEETSSALLELPLDRSFSQTIGGCGQQVMHASIPLDQWFRW